MVLISLFAALQMSVLPGLVAIRFIRPRDMDAIKYGMAVLCLSVMIDYGLVSLLVILGVYSATALYLVMAVEMAILLVQRRCPSSVVWSVRDVSKPATVVSWLLLAWLAWSYIAAVSSTFPKIFSDWDDVVSWNRWATVFFQQQIPLDTWHYPQAIPAWWSIAYVLYGSPLEMLPKVLMPLFLYGSCAMLVEEAGKKRSYGMFAGALVILHYFRQTGYVHSGYVDIPVAMIAFCGLMFLIEASERADFRMLLVGALIVMASALVKQAGLFAVTAYAVLAGMLFPAPRRRKAIHAGLYVAALLVVVAPSYVWMEMNIRAGANISEIGYVVSGIHKGKQILLRANDAMLLLLRDGKHFLLLALPFLLVPQANGYRLFGFTGLAYLCLWACFYSYDQRNGFLAWPLLVVAEAMGVEWFVRTRKEAWRKIIGALQRHRRIAAISGAGLVVALACLLGFKVDRPWLEAKQSKQMMLRGGALGAFIEKYYAENPDAGKYLSNVAPLAHMAAASLARKHYVPWSFVSIEANVRKIRTDNIQFLCVTFGDTGEEFERYFREKCNEGVFEVLYGDGAVFARVVDQNRL